jgi:DNA-directed RNA polymerase specialized sigma24 family protein
MPELSQPPEDTVERQQLTREALATLVDVLPPKERACILLKDVLDYSL